MSAFATCCSSLVTTPLLKSAAGNHVEREGFGDRLVSLLISFGGLLVFALMLGLVSLLDYTEGRCECKSIYTLSTTL